MYICKEYKWKGFDEKNKIFFQEQQQSIYYIKKGESFSLFPIKYVLFMSKTVHAWNCVCWFKRMQKSKNENFSSHYIHYSLKINLCTFLSKWKVHQNKIKYKKLLHDLILGKHELLLRVSCPQQPPSK